MGRTVRAMSREIGRTVRAMSREVAPYSALR